MLGVLRIARFMNANQKKLTIAALIVFAATIMYVPWDLTGNPSFTNGTRYAPIFFPPDLGVWPKREIASSVYLSWLVIGVVYAGLFALLGKPKSPPTKKSDE